ncbi:MAG: zinc-ribbon domain containing protein [Succiniclasticum sp.]|uniref:protein kinase domain-containing protein n=1 Tax=Succiniclasticum sp. TaxID=2775030 RepID=UPI002A91DAF4|nr:zinc-ribbon domain containing protein [Succiniclasticum sp.]MDY6290995.1 zinc-ribbon domain containing protein [Succiniclasticum sp.]
MSKNINSQAENSRIKLENYVKEYKIFIDTCSIVHFASIQFWNNIIPYLRIYKKRIIIPLKCFEELEKHSNNQSNNELAKNAKTGLEVISRLIKAGCVELRGEKGDNFADNVFQVVFTKFRLNYKLLLITQDNNLAKDILALNDNKSVKADDVHVQRINKYGYLSSFPWRKSEPNISFNGVSNIPANEIFKQFDTVTKVKDVKLNVSHIPQEGDAIYTDIGNMILIKKIASGGEGTIYETNSPYVAKIYKKENNTRRKYEKIKLMLSKQVKCNGICFPVSAIYNSQNEFVGYLMPEARGKELQRSIFIKPLFLKNFPSWKKRDTVELCITILEKIKYLHDRNVIIGDINPANILVVSPKEVNFVDTDSYQIEDYPCPVGTVNFTAPEIQRKHFSDFLRTIGNENFAVATLLFMIMLPGKPPYSQQGGENPINNIINMDFSYPFELSSNKKTPDGPWRFIWSHLTYDLKKAFYNTFRKNGANATEATRLNVSQWLSIFRYYLELLDSGKYGMQDKMSEDLFPVRHKKNPNATYVKCIMCGMEVDIQRCQNGICPTCLNKGEVYRCKNCGKELLFTNYQKYIKKAKKHDICRECYEYGNRVKEIKYCIDCGRAFEITNNEYGFYRERGLDLPKRCKSCRTQKKLWT